jgi:hypothetical protein
MQYELYMDQAKVPMLREFTFMAMALKQLI